MQQPRKKSRFKIFSNHDGITPKFKLLWKEIRYSRCAVGGINKQFLPKYLPLISFEKSTVFGKSVRKMGIYWRGNYSKGNPFKVYRASDLNHFS